MPRLPEPLPDCHLLAENRLIAGFLHVAPKYYLREKCAGIIYKRSASKGAVYVLLEPLSAIWVCG